MVKKIIVNGENFTRYDMDNLTTIKTRIAIQKKTLPEYVELTDPTNSGMNNLTAVTIEDELKTESENSLIEWFETQKERFPGLLLSNLPYLYWYYHYQEKYGSPEQAAHQLLIFEQSVLSNKLV